MPMWQLGQTGASICPSERFSRSMRAPDSGKSSKTHGLVKYQRIRQRPIDHIRREARDGPKRDLGSPHHSLAAPASKSNVVQETGCVSENMSTILLVMPFTIST